MNGYIVRIREMYKYFVQQLKTKTECDELTAYKNYG